MTRTFIALELDESLQRFLGNVIHRLAQQLPSVRWVDPTGIHLTLSFLGELSDEQLSVAKQAADAAAQQITPFEFRLKELGMFGSQRQPRVIWMGIEESSGNLFQRLLASKESAPSSPRQYAHDLSVMKSELLRSGARYTCLAAYPLNRL